MKSYSIAIPRSVFIAVCRADRLPSCPLLGVLLPRLLIAGAAVDDPNRPFAAINCRVAKGLLDHFVGE